MLKLKTILRRSAVRSIAFVVLGAFLGYAGSCAISSRKAEQAQAALLVQVAQKDAANAKLEAENKAILAQVGALEAENARIEAERARTGVLLAQATGRITDLENAEPVQPELEGEPLVISLRFQILEHKNRYSLAMKDIADANLVISNQVTEIKGLKQAYDNAVQQYVNSDALLASAVRTNARLVKQNTALKTATKVSVAVAVVLVVVNLVK